MLAFAATAVDDRHAVDTGPDPDPAGEPAAASAACFQFFVGVLVPGPPPDPEPARVMPQRVVGVERDPVHAVVAARQKILVPLAEPVDHALTVGTAEPFSRLPGG
jgi:hypothetical protein